MTEKEWLGESNQIGIDIWQKKYKYENETFDNWLNRVSGKNELVKNLIIKKKFLFGGRILANRGLEHVGRKISLSNCYVLDTGDSIEQIFETAKQAAKTYSYGGGVGINLTPLSPKGAKINNAAKTTTGAVSFMDLYSLVTELIGQSGRRGALMLSLSCNHPDIEEFIDIKNNLDKVNYANISVQITDMFMQAVEKDTSFDLEYTRETTGEIIKKTINARNLFHKLAENNWNNAEPGCLFWDNIENWNLLSNTKEFKFSGVNPCAEEPLPAGGACLLGSMNLSEYVTNSFTTKAEFNFKQFNEDIQIVVEALNTVLDEGLPLHPLQIQKDTVEKWRQIGCGIMGLADMLIKLGITYGGQESIDICDKIGKLMINSAVFCSSALAELKGSYAGYDKEAVINTSFFKTVINSKTAKQVDTFGLRNSQLLTIAPTGTLSTMLGISGGVEPIFANYYNRTTKSLHGKDVVYKVYTPIVKNYMETHNILDDSELPEYFITAQDLDYHQRIDMQAVWQKYIDASISSTVNLPNSATIADVENLYLTAWKKGLKGITIFRDGCSRGAILTTKTEENREGSSKNNQLNRGDIILVDDNVFGLKRKLITGCGSLHFTAFFDPASGDLLETYVSKGSTGGCENSLTGLSRMISIAARCGCSIYDIVDQLNSTGTCPSYSVRKAIKGDTSKGSCCPMAIGNALLSMYKEMQEMIGNDWNEEIEIRETISENNSFKCPQCGEKLIFEGGCNSCKACGYSKCD